LHDSRRQKESGKNPPLLCIHVDASRHYDLTIADAPFFRSFLAAVESLFPRIAT
jgi:hypothetical protein